MKTLNTMSVRHLSGVPLLTENGEEVEILPYSTFDHSNPDGKIQYNIITRLDYWHIQDHYEVVSENVYRIFDEFDRELLVTPDWEVKD